MNLLEAMQARHSVRQYLDTPLTDTQIEALQTAIRTINKQSGLHIQLFTEEPECFTGALARYGNFSGVRAARKGKEKGRLPGLSAEKPSPRVLRFTRSRPACRAQGTSRRLP